jgi:hypothetical protein
VNIIYIFLALITLSCSTQNPTEVQPKNPPELIISEIEPNRYTALASQNLQHLIKIYNLTPLIFTKQIYIQSKVIPKSHPVLTLNTRHAENPNRLLADFIHEQLHWYLEIKQDTYLKIRPELEKNWPSLPTNGVAQSPESTYLHLVICTLEYDLLIKFLGLMEANKILKDTIYKDKIYPWIYLQIYEQHKSIMELIRKFELHPLKS